MSGKTIFILLEFSLTPQHLIELPRIEQLSLWTCCQQLEAQWDFLQGFLLLVQWRSCTLLQKQFGKIFPKEENSATIAMINYFCAGNFFLKYFDLNKCMFMCLKIHDSIASLITHQHINI